MLDTLEQLRNERNENRIGLAFARISDSVRELFRRSGFLERLGKSNVFWGVDSAVDALTQIELGERDGGSSRNRSAWI